MQTLIDKQQKWLLKKFHTLCSRLGMDDETKRAMIRTYGVESSRDLPVKDLTDLCTKLEQIFNPQLVGLDKWRKRLIASIGGWLRAMSRPENIKIIKAIACRAAQVETFNDIPMERLRSLYAAFNKKKKDLAMVEQLTIEELDILTLVN
ncbi:MAG: regulatory protein GemA [Candidatus Azobacteroides sp.]|nr:regulatory protein GemA [Candidatus Azobacteroides sp.]